MMNRTIVSPFAETLGGQIETTATTFGLDNLGGAQAAQEIGSRLAPANMVKDFVFDKDRYDQGQKFSKILTEGDSNDRFGEVIGTLSGYMVLAMSPTSEVRPVLVDGELGSVPTLRLNFLADDNMSEVGVDNQQAVLSAVAQVEAPSMGSHEGLAVVDGHQRVGEEPKHMLTSLGGATVPIVRSGATSLHVAEGIARGVDVTDVIRGNVLKTFAKGNGNFTALPVAGEWSYTFQEWRQAGIRLVWPVVDHFEETGPRPSNVSDAIGMAIVQGYKSAVAAGRADEAKRLQARSMAAA